MAGDIAALWAAIDNTKDALAQTDRLAAERIATVDKRTTAHEAVCAERYWWINVQLGILIGCFVFTIAVNLFGYRTAILMALKAAMP